MAIVALSVALAIVISLVALWLTFHLRTETKSMGWRKLGSAILMGAAIHRGAPMPTPVRLGAL